MARFGKVSRVSIKSMRPPSSGYSRAVQRSRDARSAMIARVRTVASTGAPGRTGGRNPSRAELKAIDVNSSVDIDDAANGHVSLLNGCAQGSDINQRIGRKIMMKSFMIRANATNVNGTGTRAMCRVMLVYDSQANAAAPTTVDLLTADDPDSALNLNNRERFRVLWDKTFVLGGEADDSSLSSIKSFKKFIRFPRGGLPVIFNSGNAGTIADITSGSLYLMTSGNNVDAAGTTIPFEFYSRVRFVDP